MMEFQTDTQDRNKKLFPQKMWELIHDERYHFCLRWSADGQLVYLNRDEFEEYYLKKQCNQFNTQKSISFVRQMNMYGFRKVDDCYYENDNFKQNCHHLLKNMIRRHPNKAPFNEFFPNHTNAANSVNNKISATTTIINNSGDNNNCPLEDKTLAINLNLKEPPPLTASPTYFMKDNTNVQFCHQQSNTTYKTNNQAINNLANHRIISNSTNSPTATTNDNNKTPSPIPMNSSSRYMHNFSCSNNGSVSSTLSPSPTTPTPSIDNNNIDYVNMNNNINHIIDNQNFHQQLSNMVLNLSNHHAAAAAVAAAAAIQYNNKSSNNTNPSGDNDTSNRNNNNNIYCPIKYELPQSNHSLQMNNLLQLNQVTLPIDLQLELKHQYELQQKIASIDQPTPVSPLTKKLVTEICFKRNVLMDQSVLIDAARYTENFLNVLLDDALLIAQHSAGLDPADNSNQPVCSSIDASSLTLALKLLPSKLLSSVLVYNKP